MLIEDLIKEIDEFEPIKFIRLNFTKFFENISFDERYFKRVKEFKDNKERYKISNLLKEVRRNKLINNKKR